MLRLIEWAKRRPFLAAALVLLGVGAGVFGLIYFQPQKLLLDQRVDEAVPQAEQPTQTASAGMPEQIASSPFRSLEHETTGKALLTAMPDGSRVLSLVDFETSNGPDLRVYLSAGDSDRSFGEEYGQDFIELGRLKGNIGDQNYDVPSTADLSKYRNAVIWCKRFSVGFGVATFSSPDG